MNAYCDRQSVEFTSIAFLFDGRRLRAEQTPEEVSLSLSRVFAASSLWVCGAEKLLTILSFSCFQLEMEDGDEIDAMLHQTGGTTA